MGLKHNGKRVFCATCGSFDLEMFEDELLGNICKQPDFMMIKCNDCNAYFSKNYAENYEDEFTDEKHRHEIIRKRIELRRSYSRPIEIAKPEEKKKARKRKRKLEETPVERSLDSF